MRTKIKKLKYSPEMLGQKVAVKGWVRTVRKQKSFAFVELNDGSTLSNFQVVIDSSLPDYEAKIDRLSTGVSVAVEGELVKSPGQNQAMELKGEKLEVIGDCPPDSYPLQKKRHSLEFLRTIAHLRPRTNTIGAVTRVRNELAWATHRFFQERGFIYLNTPIITASDCEGAGEMFRVTTLKNGEKDESKDFFGKSAFLTVSGQLNGEIFASALSDIYTFGPTFRAENSNTSRHLAEFWMIEPEIAFADLNDDMDLAEAYLKYVFKAVLTNCEEDMEFFEERISPGVIERLQAVVEKPFKRVTYTDAIEILLKSGKQFDYPVSWGCDLQSEHERYLAEEHFNSPVIVTNYPKEIKAFYMRLNEDGKTVAAMDVLVPKVGELIGGSQREERLDVLEKRLEEIGLDKEAYWWYLELRKYGSVPHAGFGAGFERLVQFVTGMENIRDVIPFPRYPGNAEF